MQKLEQIMSTVLTIAVVVLVAVYVDRSYFHPPVEVGKAEAEFVSSWRSELSNGRKVGTSNEKIVLMEYSDLQCPFCARYHPTIDSLLSRYPTQVSFRFIHFPLTSHSFALVAAKAAECASEQDKFYEMISALYESQAEFSKAPWAQIAARVGVTDTVALNRCIQSTLVSKRIGDGLESGKRIGLRGTPTILLNGWRYAAAPSLQELDEDVKQLLAGKMPHKQMR